MQCYFSFYAKGTNDDKLIWNFHCPFLVGMLVFCGQKEVLASNFLGPWYKWYELGNLQKGQQPKDGNQS